NTTPADTEITSRKYDGMNRLTESTSTIYGSGSSAIKAKTSYLYDNAGNLIGMIDPQGNASSYPMGQVTTYFYDHLNRRIGEIDPSPGTGDAQPHISYSYDPAGNLTGQSLTESTVAVGTVPTIRATSYVYDSLNRRIQTVQTDVNGQSYAT